MKDDDIKREIIKYFNRLTDEEHSSVETDENYVGQGMVGSFSDEEREKSPRGCRSRWDST